MQKTIRILYGLKKILSLSACLLIALFGFHLIISQNSTDSSIKNLVEERDQILDDLNKLELRINMLREQLTEFEDSLLKKNERLSVVEGQINNLR